MRMSQAGTSEDALSDFNESGSESSFFAAGGCCLALPTSFVVSTLMLLTLLFEYEVP